jgi:7,8-dihydropterin-6-yl-methyl-4-(beta-D-ribofuranosyl)aminobenzene 5'-phosphate synthase
MKVRITTLTENTAGKTGLLAEHGLSILVEAGSRNILLDTGQTNTAIHNAHALGLDLSQLDAIVLSHGHPDHTGGLKDVLKSRMGQSIDVVAHPAIWRARYGQRGAEKPRYAGNPFLQEEMETLGAHFCLATGPQQITPGISTTGEVPRTTPFEKLDQALKVRDGKGWRQDDIPDDQALVISTEKGLVVVLGCAHSGIVNTLMRARQVSGEERVYAVVGGTHLGFASSDQLDETVQSLRAFGIHHLGVSHCTGLRAAARLAHEFGDAFFFNNAGTVTELM